MSPRAYNLGLRQASTEETRARIIEAARELLGGPGNAAGFRVDAVARLAGVARVTVYYQFGSKLGLLEALYNDLAARGLADRLPAVFHESDPLQALYRLIEAFCHFWATDRVVTRRLRALALLDDEVGQGIRERDEWRRGHFQRLVGRLQEQYGQPEPDRVAALDLLYTLTSFESYDLLARDNRDADAVAGLIKPLSLKILGLEPMAATNLEEY